jgi:hypothetical protein
MATGFAYGQGVVGQYGSTAARRVDWLTDTIKVALLLNTYTPDVDLHDFYNDVSPFETSGTLYTAGGVTLGGKTLTYDNATNETRLDANDAVWGPGASFTAYFAVVYKDTGAAATSPIMGYVDFGGVQTVTLGTFTIQWNATGVIKGTV